LIRPIAGSLVAFLVLGASSYGWAQSLDDTRARADALFREGQQLINAGEVAAACPKLEESNRLDPKIGRLLNVAYCHERLGRTATAWNEYNQAAAMAVQVKQTERESFARGRAAELATKLSFIRLDLGGAPEVAQVTIDGRVVAHEQWAVPFPIDPGEHALRFEAPGHKAHTQSVTIGASGTVRVAVAPLEVEESPAPGSPAPASASAPAPTSAPAPAPEPAPAPSPAPEAAPAPASGGGRLLGWIVGGVGVVGVGVGTGFGLHALALRNEADCPNKACTPDGIAHIHDATTFANIASVGFGVGIVGLAAGTWLLVRPHASSSAQTRIIPIVAADRAGIVLSGGW
jgi:hypothetical protein